MNEQKLDMKTILQVPIQQFLPWLVVVIFATWGGYPGVVCITPLAWLISLNVGIVCFKKSKSVVTLRAWEALIAGSIFGLLQGILFIVITPTMGPIREDETTSNLVLSLFMVVGGMLISAGLAYFSASSASRKHKTS